MPEPFAVPRPTRRWQWPVPWGVRSSITASLLKRHGVDRLEHVVDGGVRDLESYGVELRRG